MKHDWLVIGAGPAGIAAVGKLLDQRIQSIAWLDPAFAVGDLGTKWHQVSSNTRVALFQRFLNGCAAFDYGQKAFPIDKRNPADCCPLAEIAEPLKWVTDKLGEKVAKIRGEALALRQVPGGWSVKTKEGSLTAKNVILATGAAEKTLGLPSKKSIGLAVALHPQKLAQEIQPDDIVGVFGSSHSAILILANLLNLPLKKVYNFYRSPHLYAVYLDDWILFDNTGLKGFAADWARRHLDGTPPPALQRLLTTDPAYEEALALCNKVVCAVGFERRATPVIETYPQARYNEATGIIAPGLFGLGIAYPQAAIDRLGNREYRVGLWKFMDFLNQILPIWVQTGQK